MRLGGLVVPVMMIGCFATLLPGGAGPGAGVALAQDATLYEVTENLKLKPLLTGQRQATATLMGSVVSGTALCPVELAAIQAPARSCAITAVASDRIDLRTGRGPVSGEFAIVIQGDNPVDGPELVILRGEIEGTIDLAPAVLDGVPIGTISGRWTARGVQGGPLARVLDHGTLAGTFRLPFVYGLPDGCLVDPTTCAYVSPPVYLTAAGTPAAVEPRELSLATPTVKLELTFTPDRGKR
jgi:hypothetical protein